MDILGLPLHPLVVHAAVVLLPLAALGALVIVISERARTRYGSLVVVGSVAAFAAVLGARVSGEAFAGTTTGTGALGNHMFWGLAAPWPAGALVVTTLLLVLAGRGRSRPLFVTCAALTVLAALAGLVVIVLTGHSGATAVWGTAA